MQGLPVERVVTLHWRGDDDFVQHGRHKLDLALYTSRAAAQLRALEARHPDQQAPRWL